MNDSVTVSIIIVAHNNWPDLELALESALNQSWPACEVVLVDNASIDATESAVRSRYSARIKYIRQENLMDAAGYNAGVRESSGDFIQILDGDDFLAPNKIEKQIACFREHPGADIIYGDVRQIQSEPGRPAWSDWNMEQVPDMLDAAIRQQAPVIHSALIRRAAIERIGGWDESIVGADHEFWLRAAANPCVFRYCPGSWCFQRRGGQRQLSSQRVRMLERSGATLSKATSYVKSEPHRTTLLRRLARLQVSAAWGLPDLTRDQRLSRVAEARKTDPNVMQSALYGLLWIALCVPGMRSLGRIPPLRAVTRAVAARSGLTG